MLSAGLRGYVIQPDQQKVVKEFAIIFKEDWLFKSVEKQKSIYLQEVGTWLLIKPLIHCVIYKAHNLIISQLLGFRWIFYELMALKSFYGYWLSFCLD